MGKANPYVAKTVEFLRPSVDEIREGLADVESEIARSGMADVESVYDFLDTIGAATRKAQSLIEQRRTSDEG